MKSNSPSARTEAAVDLQPWLWVLMVLFGAAWFMPTEATLRGGVGMPLNVLWFIWLAALIACLAASQSPEKLASLAGWTWSDCLWLGFFGWHTASVLLGWHFRWLEPRPAIGLMWQQLAMAALYFGGRLIFRSEETRGPAIQCLVALGFGLSLFAWYQYLVVLPDLHQQYSSASEAEKIAQLIGAGITDTEPGSRIRELFESRLFNREPFATFTLTNTLAAILVPVVLISLILGLGRFAQRNWSAAGLWLAAGVVSASALALTSSRTALLAFGLTTTLWTASRWRPGGWLAIQGRLAWCGAAGLVVLPIGIVVALWALGQSDSRLFSGAPESVKYRLEYWVASSQMIAVRPWFGWGPGNFQSAYAGFQPMEASETVADPHNFFFEIAATAGLPAAFFFLAAVSLSLASGRKDRPTPSPRPVSGPEQSDGSPLPRFRWAVGLVLPTAMMVGSSAAWLGESMPGPLQSIAAAVVIASVWWATLRFVETSQVDNKSVAPEPPITDAVRWGMLGLLLSLLASGGVNYPAIAGCLVLMASLSVTQSVEHELANKAVANKKVANKTTASKATGTLGALWHRRELWLFVSCVLAALACSMYLRDTLPVIRSEWAMQRAKLQLGAGNVLGGQHDLNQAKQLDPLRADVHVELAVLEMLSRMGDLHQGQRRAELAQQFQAAARLRPFSSPTRRRFAEAYLQAAALTRDRALKSELLNTATEWLSEAVDRKPVDAALMAQWSWSQHAVGAEEQAQQSARRARSIGEVNLHPDLRLDQQWFLAVASETPVDPTMTRPVGQGQNGMVLVNVAAWVERVLTNDVTAK